MFCLTFEVVGHGDIRREELHLDGDHMFCLTFVVVGHGDIRSRSVKLPLEVPGICG